MISYAALFVLLRAVLIVSSEIQHSCNNSCDKIVHYDLKPIKIGVEISGIDLKQHATNVELFEEFKEAVHRHRLVVFRNQGEIPGDLLLMISQKFGTVYMEPFATQTKTSANHKRAPSPAIVRISNDINEGFKGIGTEGWHIDGAFKTQPYAFTIFNAVNAPRDGDTKFIGFRELLDSLDEKTYAKWNKMWEVDIRRVLGKYMYETHPLMYTHPIVNETVMCFHLGYVGAVVENYGDTNQRILPKSETLQLRDEITREIEKDNGRLIYSHRWQEGDLTIIDNLQLAHLASKESQLPVEQIGLRVLHRVSIVGVQEPAKVPDVENNFCPFTELYRM